MSLPIPNCFMIKAVREIPQTVRYPVILTKFKYIKNVTAEVQVLLIEQVASEKSFTIANAFSSLTVNQPNKGDILRPLECRLGRLKRIQEAFFICERAEQVPRDISDSLYLEIIYQREAWLEGLIKLLKQT